MLTVCAVAKVPPAGENIGVAGAAAVLMVYVAVVTLDDRPSLMAMALMVVELLTVIAEVYFVDDAEGVEPLVV